MRVRDFAALVLIPMSLWSCSLTPIKSKDLRNAPKLPANPSWLKTVMKPVAETEVEHGLFPDGFLAKYVPTLKKESSKKKSKYDSFLKGRLAGYGAEFEAAAKKHGIPVELLIAICSFETGYGSSDMLRDYRNPGGNLKYDKVKKKWVPYSFKTIGDGIEFTASNLSRNYWNKGLRTVSSIRAKYAPSKTGGGMKHSDPNNKNKNWVAGVTGMMKKIQSI